MAHTGLKKQLNSGMLALHKKSLQATVLFLAFPFPYFNQQLAVKLWHNINSIQNIVRSLFRG